MREMVEYWKKVRGESKTDDVNPIGCRAYETTLDTSLTLYQNRTARCRSRVSTVCLPWDTNYQVSLEIGNGGEGGGDKIRLERTVQKRYATLTGLSNILSHLPHAARFKKTHYTKTTAETICHHEFHVLFPNCHLLQYFRYQDQLSFTISITIITATTTSPSPSPLRGIIYSWFWLLHKSFDSSLFWFWWCYELGRPLENYWMFSLK